MTLYIQDGAVGGHALWLGQALDAGVANGAIISPFFTPLTHRRGQKSAQEFADIVRSKGGEVVVDATTHALSLPGTNNWTSYDTWNLWNNSRGDLSTEANRKAHIEAVFERQVELGAHTLTPTVALENAIGSAADTALALADDGKSANKESWQSLAGRRGFWLSPNIDNYVGAIQQLRSPVWFVTLIRDNNDYPPDTSEVGQTAAFCRTVDSLSRRSRVIVCHADLYGLPAIAAGASGLGTGWHTKQRVCSPVTFQMNDPDAIRRQAKWFTYFGLAARMHSHESQILASRAPARARSLYAGGISHLDADIRLHHLSVVQDLLSAISDLSSTADRVSKLRETYEDAVGELDNFARLYSRIFTRERIAQIDGSYQGLKEYAQAEGIWAP